MHLKAALMATSMATGLALGSSVSYDDLAIRDGLSERQVLDPVIPHNYTTRLGENFEVWILNADVMLPDWTPLHNVLSADLVTVKNMTLREYYNDLVSVNDTGRRLMAGYAWARPESVSDYFNGACDVREPGRTLLATLTTLKSRVALRIAYYIGAAATGFGANYASTVAFKGVSENSVNWTEPIGPSVTAAVNTLAIAILTDFGTYLHTGTTFFTPVDAAVNTLAAKVNEAIIQRAQELYNLQAHGPHYASSFSASSTGTSSLCPNLDEINTLVD